MASERRGGWGFIAGARKAHYYGVDGRSLCGRHYKFTDAGLTAEDGPSPDDCLACRRKLDARTSARIVEKEVSDGSAE